MGEPREAFRALRLIRKRIVEDANGDLWIDEVRKHDASGEQQRLTYRLDTPSEGD